MPTVKEAFGFLPYSVWDLKKPKSLMELIRDTGDPTGKKRTDNSNRKIPNYRYSIFNPAVADRIIRYYSNEGDKIVDPCGGRSTRGVMSIILGRNYEGYEIAPETHKMTVEQLEATKTNFETKGDFVLHHGDGCLLSNTPDKSCDLAFTCPPYHQQEKYESFPGQLSDINSYEGFLDKIGLMAKSMFRVLKNNTPCVWVINDWRDSGEYRCFHGDSIDIFRDAGFKMWDVIINVLHVPWAGVGVATWAERYRAVKSHEYILVFAKGDLRRTGLRLSEENIKSWESFV